jgi:hypothetical protein
MSHKNLLYIGSPFFGYYKKIIKEFEVQGYSVDYYNDRPSENPFVKGLIKVRKNIMESMIQKYFDKIVMEIKEKKYNLVFVVNCKVFTPKMIEQMKDLQPNAKFILYMWDALKLYPNTINVIHLFDKAYSFDTEDCANCNKLSFLPLFYCNEYEKIGKSGYEIAKHDIVSVCTAHPNRYKIINKLFPLLESNGITIFSYMFLHRLQYFYNKLFVEEFRNAKRNEFKFNPLSEQDILQLIAESRAVFDIQHNKQCGLTIRTIETLGARKKLITYNSNIKNYDFYTKNNILILDDSNWSDIPKFIEQDYIPVDDEIYKKYSIKQWVKTIINME